MPYNSKQPGMAKVYLATHDNFFLLFFDVIFLAIYFIRSSTSVLSSMRLENFSHREELHKRIERQQMLCMRQKDWNDEKKDARRDDDYDVSLMGYRQWQRNTIKLSWKKKKTGKSMH